MAERRLATPFSDRKPARGGLAGNGDSASAACLCSGVLNLDAGSVPRIPPPLQARTSSKVALCLYSRLSSAARHRTSSLLAWRPIRPQRWNSAMAAEDPCWREWMRAAQQGDRVLYGALLTAVIQPLRRAVRARWPRADAAAIEDAVQETLLA